MHVPSYQRLAPVLLVVLAAFAGIAQAVDFDEKLKAPQAKGAAEIKTLAENYSTTFARLEATSPAETVTNRSLYMEYFDLKWQLERAIDERRPLEDLSAAGFIKQDDGSYRIDLGTNPQWDPFVVKLTSFLPNMNLDNAAPLLINRGFRENDVVLLKQYVADHSLKAAVAERTLPVAVSFSKFVKKLDKLKKPVNNGLVFSFIYQREKAAALARQRWAEGLLGVLDAQRVRVLHSYFSEMKGSAVWAPSDVTSGVAGVLAQMRLPDFEQRANAEAKGVAP
jgi:hypothetical protein